MTLGRLTTLGYAKLQRADQVRAILDGIDLVVDVRLSPRSWQPLWGRATARTIQEAGARYLWLPGLGNVNYRTSGDIQIADIDQVETVLDELRAGVSVGLLCACYAPAGCHRRTIALEAVRRLPGLVVRDR